MKYILIIQDNSKQVRSIIVHLERIRTLLLEYIIVRELNNYCLKITVQENVVIQLSLYHYLPVKTEYNDILQDIVDKLKITNDTKLDSTKQYVPTGETVIGVVRQPWTYADMGYWSMYHIGQKTLEKFNVSSIKYYLCNGIVKGIYKDTNPMYAYKVFNNFKIYRPLADKYTKWRNNLSQDDIQGWEQLPKKGDILIITKSLKDVMCLHEMGIPAISPSSESTFISDTALEALKKRFKRILVCFDRDNAGIRNFTQNKP